MTVRGLTPVVIHGDRYLDLSIERSGGVEAVRVPLHAFRRHPQVGDRLRLKVLLGQVDSVEDVEG